MPEQICENCGAENTEYACYCNMCGSAINDLLVQPGDLFSQEEPKSAALSFDTTIPDGVFFDGSYYVFPKKFNYKKMMKIKRPPYTE